MSAYSNKKYGFKNPLKKKVFFSNELKKSLLIAFVEAKNNKVYVTPELLLYGLISHSDSISAKLISTTISQFRNNKTLTSNLISNRVKEVNCQKFKNDFTFDNSNENKFASEIWNENAITPWLSPEVKEILKAAIKSSMQTKSIILIINTKFVLFELLNKESIRHLLTQAMN